MFNAPSPDEPFVLFKQSDNGPFVGFTVSDEERSGSFDSLAERLAACDGSADGNGQITDYEPVNFLQIGDGTFAFRTVLDNGTSSYVNDIVIVRVGDLILTGAGVSQTGPFDVDILAGVLTKMADRARG